MVPTLNLPSAEINHFSKFHLISEPCFGSQRHDADGQNFSQGGGQARYKDEEKCSELIKHSKHSKAL